MIINQNYKITRKTKRDEFIFISIYIYLEYLYIYLIVNIPFFFLNIYHYNFI
jgi:hypothetical protein